MVNKDEWSLNAIALINVLKADKPVHMRERLAVCQDVRKAAQPAIARRAGTTRRRSTTTTTSRVRAGRRRPATPDEAASSGRGTVGPTQTAPGPRPGRRWRGTGCLATGFTTAVRLDAVCATLGDTYRHSTDDASRVSCCVRLTLSSAFPPRSFSRRTIPLTTTI